MVEYRTMTVKLRPAIAMIELIFAMVIMGIVLMSAPQLISQANKSGYVATQQEAIAALASHMSFVLSRHWDEANAIQTQGITILVTDTVDAIGLSSVNDIRGATPLNGEHRSFLDGAGDTNFTATAVANLGNDGAEGDTNDIDDYDGAETTLLSQEIKGNDNYIDKTMTIATAVNYISDIPSNAAALGTYTANTKILTFNGPFTANVNRSHIKRVQVTLTQGSDTPDDLNKTIVFESFSCNIGRHYIKEIPL